MAGSTLKRGFWASLFLVPALLAACAAGPSATAPETPPRADDAAGTPPEPQPTVDALAPYPSTGHAEMDAWRLAFASRAAAEGRDPAIIRAVLEPIRPLDLYLSPDVAIAATGIEDQAEFAKPIWEYIADTVSDQRKRNGRAALAEYAALFDALEARYGVDRQVLTAIWGMETSYGAYIGSFDAANTLANMAVEGRRRSFAERELLALIQILERGYATRDDLTAGWAGAMGQTQFMPTTFLSYAEDFEGDGRKDVWSNPADALASAAKYLSMSGYRPGEPWGVEVRLPMGFDHGLADGEARRIETWEALAVMPVTGGPIDAREGSFAELWLPAGAEGPAFLLFDNFNVFKEYNRADSYALAVGLLSDAVLGKTTPRQPWPTETEPLTLGQVKELQSALNALGYEAGPVDGIAGRGTRGALQRFQLDRGFIADGFPTQEMLAYVLGSAG